MRVGRFTPDARRVVVAARYEALRMNHPAISSGHLLLALLRSESGAPARALADLNVTRSDVEALVRQRTPGRPTDRADGFTPGDAEALRSIGIDLDEVRRRVEATFGPHAFAPDPGESLPRGRRGRSHPRLTSEARQSLRLGRRAAPTVAGQPVGGQPRGRFGSRSRPRYGPDALLLGVNSVPGGVGAAILRELGVTAVALRTRLAEEWPRPPEPGPDRPARNRFVPPGGSVRRLVAGLGQAVVGLGRLVGRPIGWLTRRRRRSGQRPGGGPPPAGVREPRRPAPTGGSGAAAGPARPPGQPTGRARSTARPAASSRSSEPCGPMSWRL